MFAKYSGGNARIEPAGMMEFCADLGVEPTDVVMLEIAWKAGCDEMAVRRLAPAPPFPSPAAPAPAPLRKSMKITYERFLQWRPFGLSSLNMPTKAISRLRPRCPLPLAPHGP